VALDVVEGWIGRVGAVVGFVTLATALGWGVWRGLRKYRLRGLTKAAPAWVAEQILGASEHIGEDRALVWMDNN
jgi:hypothetical protein